MLHRTPDMSRRAQQLTARPRFFAVVIFARVGASACPRQGSLAEHAREEAGLLGTTAAPASGGTSQVDHYHCHIVFGAALDSYLHSRQAGFTSSV